MSGKPPRGTPAVGPGGAPGGGAVSDLRRMLRYTRKASAIRITMAINACRLIRPESRKVFLFIVQREIATEARRHRENRLKNSVPLCLCGNHYQSEPLAFDWLSIILGLRARPERVLQQRA